MASVTFDKASRIYPGSTTPAVDALDLEMQDGEFLVRRVDALTGLIDTIAGGGTTTPGSGGAGQGRGTRGAAAAGGAAATGAPRRRRAGRAR